MLPTIPSGGTALLDVRSLLSKLNVHDGNIVADLGCGGGGYLVAAAAHMVGPKGLVYAVDVQKFVLDAIDSKLKMEGLGNVRTVLADLERYGMAKIPNETCDVVIVLNMLFQNTKHSEIIREANRMVRSGGKLAVVDWKVAPMPIGPDIKLRVSPDQIKSYATAQGLAMATEFNVGLYHYGLVFQKTV